MKETHVVLGAGGFIGSWLVDHLRDELGHMVIGVDVHGPLYKSCLAEASVPYYNADLRDFSVIDNILSVWQPDQIWQLAADMGGAGYVFSGDNDADIMHNNTMINLNVLNAMVKNGCKNVFFSSSACVYPEHLQLEPSDRMCVEDTAWPANPDSPYGLEKLYAERMYDSYARNHGLRVRIARFHNIYGPYGTWTGGREKAPAALCRKVAEIDGDHGEVEIWGDGLQMRSFLFVDECIHGCLMINDSDCNQPINLGNEMMININDLALLIAQVAGKQISLKHQPGPIGVNARKSDNRMLHKETGWAPVDELSLGMRETYEWIEEQVNETAN